MLRDRDDIPLFWPLLLLAGVGAVAAFLIELGNPGNMGLCGACFLRDTSGALGLFSGPGPKIFRPEILGLTLGALLLAVARRRVVARSGSFASARFFLCVFMAIGSLVFLGCPFRLLQRLGGGDLNALVGALGLVAGVGVAVSLEKRGYSLGKTAPVPTAVGLIGPMTLSLLFLLFLLGGVFLGPGPGSDGPPAHAPWWAALLLALLAGAALSVTGFCAISAVRGIFLGKRRMLLAAAVMVVAFGAVSSLYGRFDPSFEGQPAAHSATLWNVLSMALVGLTGALAGGCPVRQLIMTGEGNGDAFVGVLGLLVGGAIAQNFGLVSSGGGPTDGGRIAVMLGLAVCGAYGFLIQRALPAPD